MTEKDFDTKKDQILLKMVREIPNFNTKDVMAISMFCTMFEDEYCEKDDENK